VRGRVNLYEARGTLQFYAEEMEPRGLGALQLAFEQLKQRLGKEGLFDPARKRTLPFLPRTVGIVTALGGAGLRDMLRILLERYPGVHVIVRPALVQGAGAAAEIAQAIDELNAHGRAEVIIVGRGGGSLEDLWAFNEETVARAIYRSAAPIVSAVGHEIDYTIADFVADVRAPTPTAAAQLVVPSKLELRRRIEETAATLEGAMRSALAGNRRELAHLEARLREPRNLLRQVRQRLDEAADELDAAMRLKVADSRRSLREISARLRTPAALVRERRLLLSRFDDRLTAAMDSALALRRRQLAEAVGRLDSLSPLKVLERGYAVVVNARDGHAVIDAASVDLGDDLDIRLNRGRLRARTTARET
jgi:exodeoxyribonuclease VII large subunit